MKFPSRLGRTTALIAAAAAALALTSCSPASDGEAAGSEKIEGKITVWSWTAPAKGLRAAIPGFKKLHPGVEVEVLDVGNPAIWSKITTGMAAGGAGLADVLNIGIDYMGNYVEEFPGKLVDFRDYDGEELEGDFPAGAWKSGSGAKGQVYGLPYEVNATGFFYRTDLFEQAGVDIDQVKTWDELFDAAKIVQDETGAPLFRMDMSATKGPSGGLWQLLTNLQGSFYFNEKGEITMNNAEGLRSLELIKKAKDMGLIEQDSKGGWEGMVAQMKGEKPVSAFSSGGWMAGEMAIDAPEMAGKWGVRKPPSVEPGGLTAAIDGGTYLSVPTTSKNKATAVAFAKYAMATTEGAQEVYKAGGMFPGYKPFITSKEFSQPVEFYGGQRVNDIFIAQLAEKTPVVNYTSDYARALKAYSDAQTKVLTQDADPQKVLDEAAELVAQQTGRKIADD
ncbi:extracellular solute-binding protein [Microbacterium bovistercoris]|uniref:Extracellular solute-binding protein n=1 Tax=Microbacterium bovistercoris TaxID=2293570 RepID=A0A371NU17_9MICO|nr:extracellular solute-binding protein [Microbacterium bovistercoris]REJ05848.1 extracellular solute-binding protein [Microbacterium bovistercoris]